MPCGARPWGEEGELGGEGVMGRGGARRGGRFYKRKCVKHGRSAVMRNGM